VPEDERRSPVLGIDFGMTSLVVAYVPGPDVGPEVIPLERGQMSLPAMVAFGNEGFVTVGRKAQLLRFTHPSWTVFGVKRILGRSFDSNAAREFARRVPFGLVAGHEGEACLQLGPRVVRCSEAASKLFSRAKELSERHLGKAVDECVVSVPAYFNDRQKAAVRESAELAGFRVRKLVHEPTAAALAYGFNKQGENRILIVDVGGFRCDVSVMEVAGNVFDVVATGGDPYLGGDAIDTLLVQWILEQIKKRYSVDLGLEPKLLHKVHLAAEQSKHELSRCRAVDLQIPLSLDKANRTVGNLRLHRDMLDQISRELVDRVLRITGRTLEQKELTPEDIDAVILVGGTARLPMLRTALTKCFQMEPLSELPPEQVVALGAALLGESLGHARSSVASDTLALPLGMALPDGRYLRIIEKDSQLPITRRVMVPTPPAHPRNIEIDIFEGEATELIDADYLGSVVFARPTEQVDVPRFLVDMQVGVDRLLTVSSPAMVGAFVFEASGHANRNGTSPARVNVFATRAAVVSDDAGHWVPMEDDGVPTGDLQGETDDVDEEHASHPPSA
jgi:molecular chaperone DnaK